MKTVRVEYTLVVMREDGNTVSENKECILYGLDSVGPEHIQQMLEQDMQASEHPALGETIASLPCMVSNITELIPTGDDNET